MNVLINNIFTELKDKYGLSRYEIERIVDSQFKFTVEHIANQNVKSVKWMHLGKIRPSEYLKHKIEKEQQNEVAKEI